MAMKDETKYLKTIDFFMVEPKHEQIHARLENWARYVISGRGGSDMAPMFKGFRSKAWQWHRPVIKDPIDELDGHKLEKAIGLMPDPWREVLRWAYLWKYGALQARRNFGMTEVGLWEALGKARSMLKNNLLTAQNQRDNVRAFV